MADFFIWAIAAVTIACVIIRPFHLPAAIWAGGGAGLLVLLGLITPETAWRGILKGVDVYLFLVGMMLLAETARRQGLFDWLAAHATRRARGSAKRLFWLIYAVGVIVTVFLSNDATAVVLTPAVAAAVKAAKAENPLPYLFVCAFIANAASFVLPISNPANLVIYHSQMPPLTVWLARFLLPSALSIAATFIVLRWSQRAALDQPIASDTEIPPLTASGRMAACGIAAAAVLLITASALNIKLGLPTMLAGMGTAMIVLIAGKCPPWETLSGISWGVLPLVGGLFVLVEALQSSGLILMISHALHAEALQNPRAAAWGAGGIIAIAGNLMNNLPAGLIAGTAVTAASSPIPVVNAVLIGVDIGPNLSVTGSLATILWLSALRREGLSVDGWTFLKLGVLVMPPALLLALASVFLH
ncbi:MAG: arsenic transporter [Acidocella sp.]|nr:arsenic transporter [Acidocella sp.]